MIARLDPGPLDRAIDGCVIVMAKLQSALFVRSKDNITRYQRSYTHAFAKLEAASHGPIDDGLLQRLRMLEIQHRRMMRTCQQSMALTQEDMQLVEQGIAKLKLAAEYIPEE